MKPPIIIAVLIIALAGVMMLVSIDRESGTEPDLPEIGGEGESGRDSRTTSGEEVMPGSHIGQTTPLPGRAFRCTVESLDPVRAGDDEDLTMEERALRDQERHDAFIERLSQSGDLNHQLTVGLLHSGAASPLAIETLAPLLDLMPENELLHWRLLEACDVRPTHPVCVQGKAEARALAILGSNGEFWAKVAYFRAKRGDDAGALDALRNAASADEFHDYWGAEVAMAFDSLAIESDISTTQRLIAAVGVSAAIHRPSVNLIQSCRAKGAESELWRDACIAYAVRKERDSRAVIGRAIGIGLQTAMYSLTGDDAAVEAAKRREQTALSSMSDPAARDGEVLLMADESIAMAWLQHLQTYGEISARKFLRSEVERVSKIPGYDPCPPRDPQM